MVEENDMISSVLELEDMPVREIMTPLVDVVAVATSDTLLDMRNLWKEHQVTGASAGGGTVRGDAVGTVGESEDS